ncbi:MAG: sigma-70 family RNA polymerase sigma factor [Dysgonamonadaceae bacterium]|jgi:RNA polymerase sigma factor (sigma-70 family)|nr:sigma-70 family RNA polymerase sigma factor [Dysgonamonadaceae bacterium]
MTHSENEFNIELSDISTLYNTYAKDMYQYGMSLCADEFLVADAIHDLMLDFYRYKENFLNIRNNKAYLFSALRHKILFLLKKSAVYADINDVDIEYLEYDTKNEHLKFEEKTDREVLIREMLSHLNQRQKEVLFLRFHEGMTFNEISRIMNINPQSVQNLFQRTINKLRKVFSKNEKVQGL